MPNSPLDAVDRAAVRSALSDLAGGPIRVTSARRLGREGSPVSRLHLDRDVPGLGSTILMTTRRDGRGGLASLRREAAGLRTARASGVTARLLHHDGAAGFLLQSDLGEHPTLQDLLLGADPTVAAGGIVQMARAIGRLHAATLDRAAEHMAHLEDTAADVETGLIYERTAESWAGIERACRDLGLPSARAAREAVHRLIGRCTSPTVLTHRDLNPTNVLITDDGARLVDLEGCRMGHPGIDACFLHYPFPHHSVPWGVLPADVVALADAEYRRALADGGASLILEGYDQVIADGAAIVVIERLNRLAVIARTDQSSKDAWRRRGQMLQQLETFHRLSEGFDDLAELRTWLSELAEAMGGRWPDALDPPPPLFPAFRDSAFQDPAAGPR